MTVAGRIRVILRFQANGGKVLRGIDHDRGLVCKDPEAKAGNRGIYLGCIFGCIVQGKRGVQQGIAQLPGSSKVKISLPDPEEATRRQESLIGFQAFCCRYLEMVMGDAWLAIDLEIGVVGKVDHRGSVRNCLVPDYQFIGNELVSNRHIQVPGKALFKVGTFIFQPDLGSLPGGTHGCHLPKPPSKPALAPVQGNSILVGKGVFFPTDQQASPGNPSGVPAHTSPYGERILKVVLRGIFSEDQVRL
jgi:hypothetical protein